MSYQPHTPPGDFPLSGPPFEVPTTTPTSTPRTRRGRASKKAKRERPDRPPTRRAANANRTIGIVVALVAVVILLVALSAKPKQIYVVRASQAIGALQSFSSSEVTAFATSAPNVESGAITGTTAKQALANADRALRHTVAQIPISAGEQISPQLFTTHTASQAVVQSNQRLVAIQADVGASAAGIGVGDYVDVVAVTNSTNPALAGVVLTHVRVAAIAPPASTISSAASSPSPKLPAQSIGNTYVLVVPATQEARLVAAAGASGATIFLTYSPTSATNSPSSVATVIQAICGTGAGAPANVSVRQLPAQCQ